MVYFARFIVLKIFCKIKNIIPIYYIFYILKIKTLYFERKMMKVYSIIYIIIPYLIYYEYKEK